MTHPRPIHEDDLQAYVDGQLAADRHAEVETHLAAHPQIRDRVQGYARQRAMLRDHFAPILAEPIPSELNLAHMAAGRSQPTRPVWWSAAAAAVLLMVGGTAGWFGRDVVGPATNGIAALTHEATASYAVYAPDRLRPVEVRAEAGAELSGWMAMRLGRAVTAPDLAPSGYRLMGGRVVATTHGPAALFMYDDDRGTRLVLLTRRMEAADRDAPMSAYAVADLSGWSWARSGIGYSVVGPTSAAALRPIADAVQRQTST